MPSYELPRGTTWSIAVLVTKAGVAVNLLGHRILATVRSQLVNGTTDAGTGYVWQGDSAGSGVVFAIPSSTTTWSAGASIALSSYWMPTGPNATGYFYQCTNAGSGHIGTTEPDWPLAQGASTPADSNGVVWTWAGQVNLATVTMPASATQALPNPVSPGIPLTYDVVDNDGAGGVYQTEDGTIVLTGRTTLSQP